MTGAAWKVRSHVLESRVSSLEAPAFSILFHSFTMLSPVFTSQLSMLDVCQEKYVCTVYNVYAFKNTVYYLFLFLFTDKKDGCEIRRACK